MQGTGEWEDPIDYDEDIHISAIEDWADPKFGPD